VEDKHKGPVPYVELLKIAPTSQEVQAGYPALLPTIEFIKSKDIFSDAHKILGDFFVAGDGKEYLDQTELCEFTHDWDSSAFPEVHAAWKAAGNEEGCLVVATYPQGGVWGAGFGGKDKATKAAKLALAVAIAMRDPSSAEVLHVAHSNPLFDELWNKACEDHPDLLSASSGLLPPDTTPVFVQLRGFPDWTTPEDLQVVLQDGGWKFGRITITKDLGPMPIAEMVVEGRKNAEDVVEKIDHFEFTPGHPLRARIKPGQE